MEDKERRDYLERLYLTNAFREIPDPQFQIFLENLFGGVRRKIKGLLSIAKSSFARAARVHRDLWSEVDTNHKKTLKEFKGKGLL